MPVARATPNHPGTYRDRLLCKQLTGIDSRSFVNSYTVLRPGVSLYTPENYTLQAKSEKCRAAPQRFEPGPSANRADALTAVISCSSHPQRRKHDIFQTRLHLLLQRVGFGSVKRDTWSVNYLKLKNLK